MKKLKRILKAISRRKKQERLKRNYKNYSLQIPRLMKAETTMELDFAAGYLIGQGKSMQEAMDEVGMIVEGVYSAKAAIRLAQKYQVELPIIEQVNKILFEDKKAADALNDLMLRDPKTESDAGAWK